MEVKFHRRVQLDLNRILSGYYDILDELGDDFYTEFTEGVKLVRSNPRFFHFDSSGLRRCDLQRFPYHFLYDIVGGEIRVWVLRHDKRSPRFGVKRFR